MTTLERAEPSTTADERTMLEGWLEYHRTTLAVKCEGLDDKQLREASAAPSCLTLLGLVRHMAEVERAWFRRDMAGESMDTAGPIYYTDQDPDGDFTLVEQGTAEEGFGTWRSEIARAREIAAAHSLDDLNLGEHPSGKRFNLRWIYTHMIEEYARHNGHADLLRERIDGVTGD
ncbi:DinB family protein [Streptomyces sp. H27-D2]|uniref:DinB family protein n=1 Tax=Streptomyces sp. H27-D2 TaxID=3046304 RepID=UPI002DB63CED|nr:DinB family protein [Streptomyces sp. H27-D2]MEC4020572.1 DinB family protein [Streptomyces sp. H27-D2]